MLSSRFEFALVFDVVSSWFDFICQSISSAIMADILDEIFVVLRPVHHAMTTKFSLSSSERLALLGLVNAALAASCTQCGDTAIHRTALLLGSFNKSGLQTEAMVPS